MPAHGLRGRGAVWERDAETPGRASPGTSRRPRPVSVMRLLGVWILTIADRIAIARQLNQRPRKRHRYRTPEEHYARKV